MLSKLRRCISLYVFVLFSAVHDIHLCPNLYKHGADNGIHTQASCSIPVRIYKRLHKGFKS